MEPRVEWWLRPDYTRWIVSAGTGVSPDGKHESLGVQAQRAHEHAAHRLRVGVGVYDRIDAILALKRSLRARLEQLDQSLDLRNLPISAGGGWLEKLEALEIIRQGMLRRLNRLRNAIEHDGAEPPEAEACKDYEELVWYFLKVTNPYIYPPTDGDLHPWDEETYKDGAHLNYRISYTPLQIKIYGCFYEDALATEAVEAWLKISLAPQSYIGLSENPAIREDGEKRMILISADIVEPSAQAKFLQDVFAEFF